MDQSCALWVPGMLSFQLWLKVFQMGRAVETVVIDSKTNVNARRSTPFRAKPPYAFLTSASQRGPGDLRSADLSASCRMLDQFLVG